MSDCLMVSYDDISLSCWTEDDAIPLFEMLVSDREHLSPWIFWPYRLPLSLQSIKEKIESFRPEVCGHSQFAIRYDAIPFGGCWLLPRVNDKSCSVGYWILRKFTRRGFATKAMTCLEYLAFQVFGYRYIELKCAVDNVASAALARKMRYKHEATLRRRELLPDGTERDIMVWSLFPNDRELKMIDGVSHEWGDP